MMRGTPMVAQVLAVSIGRGLWPANTWSLIE